ncbi:hypothetical protein LEN26_016912 [Aphanomyces euteiches]|nr:hypothetical protein LEN26_016912 [Aphanomyces euteiches]KAH9127519.1 hypothetical protein AeMF1_002184 [Aphanomyces euteiches]KAH9191773.1 hypothetical protein AeNC1_006243 [Aphanomyces euteiches]
MVDWKKHIANANWPMVIYLAYCHALAVVAIAYFTSAKWQTWVWTLACYQLAGLGITGGAHRLWSHKAFKAADSVRVFLMLCNAMANQGTIFHWSRDHRVHHKWSEKDADPHNAARGLFFAHVGWLLVKKDPKVIEAGKKINMDDLKEDWVVMLQQRFNPWINLFMCFVFPMVVAMYGWNESWNIALLVPGFFRYVFVLHATWLVNSAAHFYGYKPYDPDMGPTENTFVAFFAMGEGWHNWHHVFPYDYAASEFGVSAQWNPTKLFIDAMAKIGLVTDRKRALQAWEGRKTRMYSKAASTDAEESKAKTA